MPRYWWVFAGVVAVFSAGIGMLLGGLAAVVFYGSEGREGLYLGAACGAVVGTIWAVIMGRMAHKGQRGLGAKGLVYGVAAGVVCSTLVHVGLMIAHQETDLEPIGIGALFGIGVGAVWGLIAGAICAGVFNRGRKTEAAV